MAKRKPASIQAEARKHGRSVAAYLNDKTKKSAFNAGVPWSDDDVAAIVTMIEAGGHTVFDIAVTLGRTYYATGTARAHVSFAMRHWQVIDAAMLREGRAKR